MSADSRIVDCSYSHCQARRQGGVNRLFPGQNSEEGPFSELTFNNPFEAVK